MELEQMGSKHQGRAKRAEGDPLCLLSICYNGMQGIPRNRNGDSYAA